MKNFIKNWSISAAAGVLFGILLFIFWLFLARVEPSTQVIFFGVVGFLVLAALVLYAINNKGGGSLLMYAVMVVGAFYISGAAFKLDWLVILGLPAGLETVRGAWILHICFGGLYWVIASSSLIVLLLWLDSKHRLRELLYIATALAAVYGVMYFGNWLFPIV